MAQKYHIGDLVWAKLKGQSPWPGRVSAPPPSLECGNQTSKHYCVYFFGVNNYEWVHEKSIKPYEEFQEEMMKYCTTVSFRDAVTQIVEYLENPEKFPELCNDTVVKEELLNDAMEVDIDSPLEAEQHIQQQQQHEHQDGNVDIYNKDVNEATDTISQDSKLSMATKVMIPRISVHECEDCAVCFLDQEAFEKHKLTHIKDPIDDIVPAKRRKVDDSFNNNSNICDKNESEKCVRTITFNFMDNELKFNVKKNDQVKVPAMLDPRVALERIEAHGCEFCNEYFVDLHEYQRHKLSHLKSGRFEVIDKDVTIKSHKYPSFRCHGGIRFYRSADLIEHNKTVTCKPHTSSVELEKVSEQSSKFNGPDKLEAINIKINKLIGPAKQNNSTLRSTVESNKMFEKNSRNISQIEPIDAKGKIQSKNKLHSAAVENNSVIENRSSPQFKCKLQDQKYEQKLKKRYSGRPKLDPVKCPFCEKTFKYKNILETHIVAHTKAKQYPCEQCGKHFAQRASLSTHQKIHTGIKEFVCQFCPKAFYKNSAKSIHERTHTGHKPYSCDICSKKFSDQSAHKRHVLTHAEIKPFECDICSKRYCGTVTLRRHKISKHDKIKPFECDICMSRFSFAYGLRNHFKKVHNTQKKEQIYECNVCGKKTAYKHVLTRHKQVMHEIKIKGKPYCCNLCPKQFSMKKNLDLHMADVHGPNNFECDYCGRIFHSKSRVRIHIDGKHAIEIFCHICLKRFTNPNDLTLHKKQVCSLELFKCDICDKELCSNKSLRKHKQFVHFGFKFECDYCGAKYHSKGYLIKHMRKYHKKELNMLRVRKE